MAGFMYTLKGLPSTYNKDLQESVEPLLDCVKTVGDRVQIVTGVLNTLAIQPDKMLGALTPDMLTTDLADYLVRKGVPFRETHHISGQVVALAELRAVDLRFEDDITEVFDYERTIEMRSAKGGTSKASVKEQIGVIRDLLKSEERATDPWGLQDHEDDDYS